MDLGYRYEVYELHPFCLATAIMIYVIKDLKPCEEDDYQSQLMTLLKVNKVCAN